MQTFPCGHRVVCRKCFVKTIQVAVSQRLLPLRCVVCRAKILRLRQSRDGPFPSSVSQYSMVSCGSAAHHHVMPASHSLYSFTSGSSGFSGISNISSASSESGESFNRNLIRTSKGYRQVPRPQVIKKVKVNSKSGARSKENFNGEHPQIRIDSYEVVPVRLSPTPRTPRVLLRENKVAPQEITCRLPTIKEYAEFISEREMEREKSSSTRIRCAQKLVHQLEHNNNKNNNINNNSNKNNINNNSNDNNNTINTKKSVNLNLPCSKSSVAVTPSPPRKGSSSSHNSTRASTPLRPTSKLQGRPSCVTPVARSSWGEARQVRTGSTSSGTGEMGGGRRGGEGVGGKSSCRGKSTSSSKPGAKVIPKGRGAKREPSSSTSSSSSASSSSVFANSSVSMTTSPSVSSNISVESSSSTRSSSSSRSSSSYKSATSTKSSTSSFSTSSTVTVKSCRALIPSFRKEPEAVKGGRRKDVGQKPTEEDAADRKAKAVGIPKPEPMAKAQKKKVDGKEYHRLR